MSFASKVFTSFIQNGLRNSMVYVTTMPTIREFHVIMKPLATCINDKSTSIQNPIAGSVVSPISVITGLKRLLVPISSLINQVSGFKVKGRLKRRCKDCYFVVRQQRRYVICPTHPRHKQMAMKKRDYKTWILTHATQSKIRPY